MRRLTLSMIGGIGVGLSALLLAATSGCDSTASIGALTMKFDGIQILSAIPLVKGADGKPAQSCRIAPDDGIVGFDVGFALGGTTQWCCVDGGMEGPCGVSDPLHDKDGAVRLRDFVQAPVYDDADVAIKGAEVRRQIRLVDDGAGEVTLSARSFGLVLDDASRVCEDGTIPCTGGLNASNPLGLNGTALDWKAAYGKSGTAGDFPVRCNASSAAVAIVVDRSGSMSGRVDIDGGFVETQKPTIVTPSLTKQAATDQPDEVRSTLLTKLVNTLNPSDSLVLFTFVEAKDNTEEAVKAICTASPLKKAGALAGESDYLLKGLACYEAGQTSIKAGLEALAPPEGGRTPLWQAVEVAYDFLNRPDVGAVNNRHIIVIGDGPDTCVDSAEEFTRVDRLTGKDNLPCSLVTYDAVYQKVTAGIADPDVPQVRIHFVQLQAAGYLAPDPRQQELACLTGGQYFFINGRKLQAGSTTGLKKILEDAFGRIRKSLSGIWVLRALTDQLVDAQGADSGLLADGRVYGLEGKVTFQERLLSFEDAISHFRAQNTLRGSGGTLEWPNDRRLYFRRTCDAATQAPCLPAGTPDQCKDYCSPQRLVCLDTPADKPENTACTVATAGTPGVCCSGVCVDKTSCR